MAEQPEQSEFDPRYDPAFQRGYSGDVATGSRAAAARRRAASYAGGARPASDAPGARGSVDADRRAPADDALDPAAPVPAASAPVHPAEGAWRAPWTNPFAVAAAVLGVVVLCSGIWIVQETSRVFGEPNALSTQLDWWTAQSAMFAGPIAIALGIAIIAGVLLHCAAYWARLPREIDAD